MINMINMIDMASRKGVMNLRLDIECELDDTYFNCDWDDLTEYQKVVFSNHSTQCDGGGEMGHWCDNCHFCVDMEVTELYV